MHIYVHLLHLNYSKWEKENKQKKKTLLTDLPMPKPSCPAAPDPHRNNIPDSVCMCVCGGGGVYVCLCVFG